jgi:ABC-2 type transport system ATP-binding protein
MGAPVINVRNLTKRYGGRDVVHDLSFEVAPGTVTAFLGPNGAGKTTTLRVLLGLARADAGEALVLGRPYRDLEQPARRVGTLIDGAGFHPGRTARQHLSILAAAGGVDPRRVDVVLDEVELAAQAGRAVGGFSLGMRRRLGLAAALLGEPELLVLDEPANGLDPAGIRWLRRSLRAFAAAGGTVFVSSHVLAEVARSADEAIVLNRGELVTHTSVPDLIAGATVRVRSPDRDRLRRALLAGGGRAQPVDADGLTVTGLTREQVGRAAAGQGLVVTELLTQQRSLEDVFIEMIEEGAYDVAS